MSFASRRRNRPPSQLWFPVVVVTILAGIGVLWQLRPGEPRDGGDRRDTTDPRHSNDRQENSKLPAVDTARRDSPTAVVPIDLHYCPQGGQCFLFVRPADLFLEREGQRIRRALGPAWNDLQTRWAADTGIGLEDIEQAFISCVPGSDGRTKLVVTVQLAGEVPARWRSEAAQANAPSDTGRLVTSNPYDALVIEQPSPWMVFGPETIVREIQATGGRPPLLRRDLEALRAHTTVNQHFGALFVPTFLVHEGQAGQHGNLKAVMEFTGHRLAGAQAALFTADISNGELLMKLRVATTVEDVERMRHQITQALHDLPRLAADHLGDIDSIDPYWRRLASRFPAMLQYVVDHSQIGQDRRHLIVSTRLPAKAAHNLVLATELSYSMATAPSASRRPTIPSQAGSIEELLAVRISLSFPRQSLDQALADLEAVIRDQARPSRNVTILLDGRHLQLEGITRNQQITDFQATDATVAEVLTGLVLRANPDRSIKGPADVNQKLVWIAEPWTPSKENAVIRITTRAGAAESELQLPDVFGES